MSGSDPKKRVLLLVTSSSYRAEDFLAAAEHVGIAVTVASDHEAALGDLTPAAHLSLDFGDSAHAMSRVVDFHRKNPITAIVAAEDEGTTLAAEISARLDLPHNPAEAVRTSRRKDLFREALRSAGLPTPRFTIVDANGDPHDVAGRVADDVGFPCVVKPLSLAASRGVIRADDAEELVQAVRRAASVARGAAPDALDGSDPACRIIVEQYMPGAEVALEGLLVEGDLRCLAILDKPDPLEGPYFEETMFVTPSRHPDGWQEAIRNAARAAARAIGLVHGPVHAELRINEGGAWLIEMAPRSIGGLCSRLFRFRAGLTLEELILLHATGVPMDEIRPPEGASGAMMIPIPRAGRLERIDGIGDALDERGIEDIVISLRHGQEVVPLPEGNRYLGFIFARSEEGPEAVERALRAAHARLAIHIA